MPRSVHVMLVHTSDGGSPKPHRNRARLSGVQALGQPEHARTKLPNRCCGSPPLTVWPRRPPTDDEGAAEFRIPLPDAKTEPLAHRCTLMAVDTQASPAVMLGSYRRDRPGSAPERTVDRNWRRSPRRPDLQTQTPTNARQTSTALKELDRFCSGCHIPARPQSDRPRPDDSQANRSGSASAANPGDRHPVPVAPGLPPQSVSPAGQKLQVDQGRELQVGQGQAQQSGGRCRACHPFVR